MTLELEDEAATAALGARIAAGLTSGDAVLLSGDLGAGKTALARSILRARGVTEHVPSPTFTLVQAYDTPGLTVRHFDLYRLKTASELNELGFEDALADGAVLVEWPERAARYLPGDALAVTLTTLDESRRVARISGAHRWRDILA